MLIDLPKDVSYRDYRANPVVGAIRHAAYAGERGVPSRAEIDKLGLPAELRERVVAACREVAAIHATGDQAAGWARGDELAVAIVDALPMQMKDPRWYAEPRVEETTADPEALAGLVPRPGL